MSPFPLLQFKSQRIRLNKARLARGGSLLLTAKSPLGHPATTKCPARTHLYHRHIVPLARCHQNNSRALLSARQHPPMHVTDGPHHHLSTSTLPQQPQSLLGQIQALFIDMMLIHRPKLQTRNWRTMISQLLYHPSLAAFPSAHHRLSLWMLPLQIADQLLRTGPHRNLSIALPTGRPKRLHQYFTGTTKDHGSHFTLTNVISLSLLV